MGLIQGASDGIGLGHAFLRHVERCHAILHIIDATSIDPIHDYNMLNNELMRYKNGLLASKPQIVLINKIDVWDDYEYSSSEQGLTTKKSREELEKELKDVVPHTRIMYISAKHKMGIEDLMTKLSSFVQKVKSEKNKNEV